MSISRYCLVLVAVSGLARADDYLMHGCGHTNLPLPDVGCGAHPTTPNHCEEVSIPATFKTQFLNSSGWKYPQYTTGPCAGHFSTTETTWDDYDFPNHSIKHVKKGLSQEDVEVVDRFHQFEVQFGKVYNEAERSYRRAVFEASVRDAAARSNDSSAVFGVTQFSDLTDAEFNQQFLSGYRFKRLLRKDTRVDMTATAGPTPVDWRSKGIVSEIKNQGHCGSCWAFSVVEQIESQSMQAGILPHDTQLSVQQIVDCDDFSHGCAGGSPETGVRAVDGLRLLCSI